MISGKIRWNMLFSLRNQQPPPGTFTSCNKWRKDYDGKVTAIYLGSAIVLHG